MADQIVTRKSGKLHPYEAEWNLRWDAMTPEEKSRIEKHGGGRFVVAVSKPKARAKPKAKSSKAAQSKLLTYAQWLKAYGKKASLRVLCGKKKRR